MLKNVAGQNIGAQLTDASTGGPFVEEVTVFVTKDDGVQTIGSVGGGVCEHKGKGYHQYAPSQAETNADLVAFTFEGTGAITATVQVFTGNGTYNNQQLILAKVNLLQSGIRPTIFLTVQGDHIYVYRGDSPVIPLEELGDISDREDSFFTVKKSVNDPDSAALIKISENDGILRVNGMVPATGHVGTIDVIDEGDGNVNITYSEEVAALLSDTSLVYDYKVKRTGALGPETLRNGKFHVTADVTRSTG